jgi:hypothetical protein
MSDMTWPLMERYADRYGCAPRRYELTPRYMRRPAAWAKLIAIADALVEHDEVLWLDADVVVVDGSQDVFSDFAAGAAQALMQHKTEEGVVPNCGVWLVRREMVPFIVSAAMSDDLVFHRWWEQAAVLRLAGFSVGEKCENVEQTPLYQKTHWLDEGWNSWAFTDAAVHKRFMHACAYTAMDRPIVVRNWVENAA